MPKYNVTDPETGASLVLEGDGPPSEQELTQIFQQHRDNSLSSLGPWLRRSDIPQPDASEPFTTRQKNLVEMERLRQEDPGGWARNLEAGGIVPKFLQRGQAGIGETIKGLGVLSQTMPLVEPDSSPSDWEREETLRRLRLTPAQRQAEIESNPLYVTGRALAETAPEVHPVPPKAEEALPTKIAGGAGELFPIVASGGLAPATIALQSVGAHIDGDFESAKAQGKSDNEAADIAMNRALTSGLTQAAIWALLPRFLRNATDDWIVDRFAPAVGTKVVQRFLVGRAAQAAEMGTLGAVSGGTEAAIEGQPVIPGAAKGAASLAALGVLSPRGPTQFETEAREAMLGAPGAGAPSPDAQAWAQTFGYGSGEPVTAIRRPQAVVRPTQPFVPPEPGPLGIIPPLENQPTERTADATRIGQQSSSQETQLQGVRQGQDLQTYPAQVRQEEGGQAADRGGPVGSSQGQAAPAPDELLRRDLARYAELQLQMKETTAAMRQAMQSGNAAAIQSGQERLTALNQELENIKERYAGFPPPGPQVPIEPTPAPVAPVAPPVAPQAPPKVYPPITTPMIEEARRLMDRLNMLWQERAVPQEYRLGPMSAMNAVHEAQMGDLEPIRAWVEAVSQAPMKPPKVVRRVTSLSRFQQETDVPDILSWIAENMRLLSKSAAKRMWGAERYNQNKELWDDAPDDLPMHHSSSIYGGRNGPDTVAQAAYEEHLIDAPTTNALWAAVRQASRVRRGLQAGERRESSQLSEDEQNQIAWEEATRQREGSLPVTTEELGPGYVVEIGGERLTASAPNQQGDVYLQGSRKFGERTLREGDTIHVDALHPPEGQGEATFEPEPEPKPEPERKETFEEYVARSKKEDEDLISRNMAKVPADATAIKLQDKEGRTAIVSRDIPSGKWRLTYFTKEGDPWGHGVLDTRDQAIQSGLGIYGVNSYGPPHLNRGYEVVSASKAEPAETPATPPTLRPGEAAGELFQGADQPFNLAGETGTDADRLAREKADADRRAQEAAAAQAAQQPELPAKPVAAVGTRIGNYVKGDDGWYLVDEEGNRRKAPKANKKIATRLEEQATAPPAPPETRTPAQILSSANRVRVKGPSGATFLRVTDTDGRTSRVSIRDVNSGDNVFKGVDIAKIEAGTIMRNQMFQPIEGEVTVEDVGRTARMIASPEVDQAPPLPIEQVEQHLQQQFGVQPGGIVKVVNDPGAEWRGESDLVSANGRPPYSLKEIRINAAKLSNPAAINDVFEHELAHGAEEVTSSLFGALSWAEKKGILKDVKDRGYGESAVKEEARVRAITQLADSWKGRNWFEKAVGAVLDWAQKLGLPLTRLAAERVAARAIAEQLTFVRRGSVINQPAVERIAQSLPLSAKDWGMKEFFNAIGLQAATIGGYLHRYTRQVFHADRLEISDRARALDGMNQARELTELAQGMGGRANYYDAIRDATTLGERNEVLRSAFESATRYQQNGVNLRAKLAEKLAVIQSADFRNKLLRAARVRDRAELAEEVRKTYTLQVAASAGKIMQTLNNLRTVGGAHEQLQADLTRLQQMPQFDRAVQQHFDDIVNRLSQSDRGISLLLGGGDRNGQDIWDEYLRQRFANNLGIPQGNEFTLGQLASNVLAANRDLRNQFGSLALLARDIITTQEWNRAGSRIAQALQNDPVKGVPRILQRAATLGEREARAEAAFLTLNKGIEKTLRDYNDHEQAVRLHDAVESDPEYRRWVNDVMEHPAVQGLAVPAEVKARMEGAPQPFFRYSGQDTVYSPDGKPYRVNLQFTPENVQETMADLVNLTADISEWLDRPENANDPSRLYWQERQRLLQGVLQSAAIWNPGAIKSLLTSGSFGIPENLFQGLALPAAKLAFTAFKAFDRYFTQGKGWFGNNHDISERTIQKAYKGHGFDELTRKAYQRAFLNALAWEFRNGRDVRPGDIINGVTIKAEDLSLLHSEGRMINELYDRLWKAGKEAGAPGVMELPRIIEEFTGGAWGIRRPMEIGIHANTTLPHSFSSHGEALANQIHALIAKRNSELTKLPERVVAEGMDEAAQNAARADINQRFHDSLALTLNDPDVFQNAVLGFMRQRSENWVKLDGLSPFEQHYRAITDLVSNGDPTAPRTVEEVLDWIHQRLPPEEEWTMPRVRAQFASEWEKLGERFYKMHGENDSGIRISSDKRQTAFTQAFRQDLGPAYFYDYGWIDAGEMRRYGSDMGEFGFERLMDSLRALDQNMTEAMSELTAAAESRKPGIIKRTAEAYQQGKDFRDLQHLQNKQLELQKLINSMPKWIGANAVHAEGMSLKGMSRFVSFMIGAALTGPRTAARISGISMGGSAWKMGIVFSQLGYGRLRSYPAAAASAITSAFRVGTATMLGWYHGGERGFVPGVPFRVLMNVPGAIKSAAAAKGSEKLYAAIESVLRGTTDEQFAALGWWFDQKALGMTPDVALGSRVAGIMSASRTKGGVLSRPQNIPTGTASRALAATKLAGSKPFSALEAFVAGTNVYLPGAFGYNITYDAVGRQAGWYIDMLAANARRTFDTYERLGQLERFNFGNLTDPRNKLQPWEVLPSFAGRFRFVDPANLPGWARPNSTNLQFARELFATSTDVDLQDLLLRYWKRLADTPRDQRGAVEFLAPEELDAARASAAAEARARGIISRFVEQTHHAAPSNRPHQLQQAWPIQAILPFMGWSAQTLKLIDATLGRAAFSAESNGMTADTYAGLMIAAGMTALGVGAFAFAGGDFEARLIRQLDRLLHHKEGTVKTIDEARDAKEAAEITLHNMTASIPMLNATLNQLFGMTGYRGGNVGFQAFAFDKVNSMITYARDVYRTHDLTHGLDRLAEANIPISETIIENTFQREGLQNNRNAVRVLQKFGPQDLVERRASLSIALPTEMTPYRQALLEAIGSGDQNLVAETYAAFIQKASELGRPDPDKLARQMFSTLNPYRQAFGGVLTDQQRADTLSKASDAQRKMVETMEQNYALAASTLGLTADFEKQEKAAPLQRSGAGAAGGGVSLPSGRAAGVSGGGIGRIGGGLRRISLSGPKPPRIRLPGLGAASGGGAAKSSVARRVRLVHGRLKPRSSSSRRLSAGRAPRRRISLLA